MELEDLEDLGPAAVTPRVVKRGVARRKVKPSSNTADDADVLALSNGDERTNNGTNYEVSNARQHSVYVKTYGCSHNSSDSEYMSGLLQQHGYLLVDEQEKADVWLINSCTVKNPSEEHMVTDLKRGRALGKKLVVAGCVSQAQPDLAPLADVSLVGVQQLERVVEVVHESLQGRTMRVMERAERPSLNLPKVRRNPLIEIIPVNTGCLGSCTYCSTVYARGRLGSYEPAAIEARLASAYAEGVVEVWLTSEDTGAYGRDIGTSMPELLARLLKAVPEGRRLRVGMTNPPYILQHLDAIAELLNHPRCYAFLHVPVQSGSDGVLGRMRREYTCAEFCAVADALQAKVPDLTLATDIICGFPGETEAEHDATVFMLSKYKFPVMNISQFYPRTGTPAAKMKRVPTHIVKERTREVSALFASYRTHAHLLHTVHDCLVTEVAHDGVSLVAHTKGYVQVLLPQGEPAWMGSELRVRITETSKFYVRGEVLEVLRAPPAPEAAAAVLRKTRTKVHGDEG